MNTHPFKRRTLLATAVFASAALALSACGTTSGGDTEGPAAIDKLNIIVPANPGGGWDQTGRAIQSELQANDLVSSAQVVNVGGAGGTNGLAKLATEKDPNTLMVMGYVMVGSVEMNDSQSRIEDTTPIARLTDEPLVIVVPAQSPYQDIGQLIEAIRTEGKGVAITGGSAGGADHILMGEVLAAAGIGAENLNYVGYSGGGESLAALLGNKVQAGVSGVGEYAEQVKAGKLRALAVSGEAESPALPEIQPLSEQDVDVVLTNWRGVVAPGSIEEEKAAQLTELIDQMAASDSWKKVLTDNNWEDAYLSGSEFGEFLTQDIAATKQVLGDIGLVK